MQVVSVNVGALTPLQVGSNRVQTGIFKVPVQTPVWVGAKGLEGDHIGNPAVHGGPDQAVYLYSVRDYHFWSEHIGSSLEFGFFGENLTLSDFGPEPPCVGDVWQIGDLQLQLTAPRIPCAKLAAKVGDPKFLKVFVQANRAGAYARVLQPGPVQAGQAVQRRAFGQPTPTLDELFELWHQNPKPAEPLRQALRAPLAERARAAFERWLTAD